MNMRKEAAYWAYVDKIARQAPPVTAAQCEVLTRILAPKGWEFVPKVASALLEVHDERRPSELPADPASDTNLPGHAIDDREWQ